uniref:Uncharacterized protein n=1 Tax=Moschus moschiferus TaxID=68415 RepID=A0A8C6DZR3_MOSMO
RRNRSLWNLGEITVWPPRKQRPVRVCFIFFASQINPRFPKEPVWFGASFVLPGQLLSTRPLPSPSQSPQRSSCPSPQPGSVPQPSDSSLLVRKC